MFGHSRSAEKMTRPDPTRHPCVDPGVPKRDSRRLRKGHRNVRQCSFDSCVLIDNSSDGSKVKGIRSPKSGAVADVVQLVRSAKNKMARQVRFSAKMRLDTRRRNPAHRSELEVFIEQTAYTFNRLFMIIQGYVSLMLAGKEDHHPSYPALKRIEDLIHTESILINDLVLDLAKARSTNNRRVETLLENQICSIALHLGYNGQSPSSSDLLRYCLEFVLCCIFTEIGQHISALVKQKRHNQGDRTRLTKIQESMQQGYSLIRKIGGTG